MDMDDEELDIQALINADFPRFGHATSGPALDPIIPNDDNDEDLGDDNGNGNGYNDGDSIHSSLDGNPSHLIDNDFFYVTRNNILFPKDDNTLGDLKKLAIGAGNIPLLQELFDDPEGTTMTTLLAGLSAPPSRGSRLIAAIIDALHRSRSSAIFYFLKNIVDDLSERPYTTRLKISNMFVGNLLSTSSSWLRNSP